MPVVAQQPPTAQPSKAAPDARRRDLIRLAPEVAASLAIAVIWLAVLFDAIFGPDIVSSTTSSNTRVPSAVVVAVFAYLATRVVARYGFDRERDPDAR